MTVRASCQQTVAYFRGLGLDVTHDEGAPGEFEAIFASLLEWYREPERAAAARVFSGDFDDPRLSAVISKWLPRALPKLEGEDLLCWAADVLYIAADHATDRSTAPQLSSLESDSGTLYLLRSDAELSGSLTPPEGSWGVSSMQSPDTEAALHGIYRFDGCTLAYREHARGCQRCRAQLAEWETKADLPNGFEEFRTRQLREQPAPATVRMTPAQGVGIVIRRSGALPPPPIPPGKPWWKFW